MVDNIIRIIAGLFGLLLTIMGLRFLIDPPGAVGELGMELLDGLGRSTQLSDLAAFFIVGGVFALVGVARRNPTLMLTPAALVGTAALFRVLTAQFQGAAFATDQIVAEVVMLVVFMTARSRMTGAAD